jgi:hypothetical protein
MHFDPLSLRERAGVRENYITPHPNLLPEGEGRIINRFLKR